MTELSINLERLEDAISVFGSFDENIRLLEHELGVTGLPAEGVRGGPGGRHVRSEGH